MKVFCIVWEMSFTFQKRICRGKKCFSLGDICMPGITQNLFLNFSFGLETFFNGAYLFGISLILLWAFSKERCTWACSFLYHYSSILKIVENKIFLVKVSSIHFINIRLTRRWVWMPLGFLVFISSIKVYSISPVS